MRIKIASFNINNLSLATNKNLDRIAKIINDNDIDLIAMQEVLAEGRAISGINVANGMKFSLLRRLKGKWEMSWGAPIDRASNSSYLGNDKRGEGYAFLWKTDKFTFPKDINGNDIVPQIYSNYHVNNENGQMRLIRDPFYGRFKVKGTRVELRLLTTHILYGKPSGLEIDAGAIAMRKNEFNILAGKIYPRVNEYYKTIESVVPYTIILGDYNLNLKSSAAIGPSIPDVCCFDNRGNLLDDNNSNFKIYTVQNELTTLKLKDEGYANNYDHFSFDERVYNELVQNVYRIDAVRQTQKNNVEKIFDDYKNEVSDHVPIVIELQF